MLSSMGAQLPLTPYVIQTLDVVPVNVTLIYYRLAIHKG